MTHAEDREARIDAHETHPADREARPGARMTRIAVLCSGGGSNLQALLDAIDRGEIDGSVCVVIANRKAAYALERARLRGIPALCISKAQHPDEAAYQAAYDDALRAYGAELVVLAGFLSILGPDTVRRYAGRILNVHPALLPSFGGRGMYGHHVHEAVLAYGCKVSGATVHYVDEGTDTGPIVLQRCVPVLDGDDAQALADRVLSVEHALLPEAVRLHCASALEIVGRTVQRRKG